MKVPRKFLLLRVVLVLTAGVVLIAMSLRLKIGRSAVSIARAPFSSQLSAQKVSKGPSAPSLAPQAVAVVNGHPFRIGAISGMVTDEGGHPITSATITQFKKDDYWSRAPANLTPVWTDTQGRYWIDALPPGEFELHTQADGYATALHKSVSISDKGDATPQAIDFVLTTGTVVCGTVTRGARRSQSDNADENGLEGATIILTGVPADASGQGAEFSPIELRAVSGPDGAFAFPHVSCGMYHCSATRGGLRSDDSSAIIVKKDAPPIPIHLRMPPAGRITGHVIDSEKRPVPGARIRVVSTIAGTGRKTEIPKEDQPEVYADASGGFVLDDVEEGSQVSLRAEADGFAPTGLQGFLVDSKQGIEVVLTRGGALKGRVVEVGSRRPLTSLRVMASYREGPVERIYKPTTSTAEGLFEFTNLPAGRCEVAASGVSGSEMWFTPVAINIDVRGNEISEVVLEAVSAVSIQGTVRSSESRAPLEGAIVEARVYNRYDPECNDQDAIRAEFYRETKSELDGTFHFSALPCGRTRISSHWKQWDGGAQEVFDTTASETLRDVELLLPLGGTISGTVEDESGRPVAGVPLGLVFAIESDSYFRGPVNSDAGGNFRFANIDLSDSSSPVFSGSVIVVTDGSVEYVGRSVEVSLSREKPNADIILRVRRGASVSGTVRGPDGDLLPIIGVFAEESGSNAGDEMVAKADIEGRYVIHGLHEGQVQVGISMDSEGPYKTPESRRFAVTLGQSIEGVDFVLERKEPANCVLRGQLVDLLGEPLAGWRVDAIPVSGGTMRSDWSAFTGVDGIFIIGPVKKGLHRLRFFSPASTAVYEAANVEACVDGKGERVREQTFVLPHGGVVRGRLIFEGTDQSVRHAEIRIGPDPTYEMAIRFAKQSQPEPSEDGVPFLMPAFGLSMTVDEKDEGRFQIDSLPVALLKMQIFSESALPREIKGIEIDETLLTDLGDITISPGHLIKARLLNVRTRQPCKPTIWAQDSEPPDRADVNRSRGANWPDKELYRLTQPDASGVIVIGPVPDDLKRLTIMSDECFPYEAGPFVLSAECETDLGTLLLDPGYTLTGRFIDGSTGQPCASMSYAQADGKLVSGKIAESVTMHRLETEGAADHEVDLDDIDSNGRFVIRRIPRDLASLTLFVTGYEKRLISPVALSETGAADLGDVVLERYQPSSPTLVR